MAIDRRRRLDPIDLQGQSKYQEQGITRISNNDSVVKRDSAGNIELQENKNNPLLIIEPIYKKILNSSVIKVLDTQFNYFKFPVRIAGENLDLSLDLDLNLEQSDDISANLIIPTPLDSNQQPQNTQKISTTFDSNWYYGDNAPNSKGYRELPFVGGTQPNANGYTITKEILDSLKQQNKTIRFKFAVQYRTSAESRTNFNTRLTRSNRKTYNPLTLIFNKQQNVTGGSEGDANPYGFTERNFSGDYPYLVVTYVVDIDNTKADDVYKLSAVSGNAGVILAQNSYWDVDIIDIPDTTNEIYENVYSINDDTAILTGDNQLVVLKSSENNQVATLV